MRKYKLIKSNTAVAEIVGSVLLLAMAVAAFSVVYIQVLSDEGPSPEAYVTVVGMIENNNVVFEHRSGKPLGLDTSIILSIGNIRLPLNLYDSNLLEDQNRNDDVWNIGERLLFNEYNLSYPEVQATIVDKKTNSIVWWGILKSGGIYQTLGARWYFDENTGNIAYDSLNENHGRLKPDEKHGPQWDSQIKYGGVSSLRFSGSNDSIVFVPGNTLSLDIVNNLSVEAYVKLPQNKYITDMSYGITCGYMPNIMHIYDNIYAVAYSNQGYEGFVKTVNISNDGMMIENIYNDNISFDSTSYWPKISHVSDNVYIVAYSNSDNNPTYVKLKTLNIANNGTTGPLLGSFTCGFKNIYDHEIIKISDNHIALVYRSNYNGGPSWIKTFNITNNGLTISDYKTFKFDDNGCYEPDVIHISGNIYGICYAAFNNRSGVLKTVEITPEGVVNQVNDAFYFDTINATYNPDIKLVYNNIYAIVYRDSNSKGHLITVEITEDGTITKKLNDTLIFENDYCYLPKIIHMVDDFFVVAYEGKQQDGYVAVVKIEQNGLIDDTIFSKFKFNDGFKNLHGMEPDIIRVSDYVYAIAFRAGSYGGQPHEGRLLTFSLLDDIDPYIPVINRGVIYKQDTWGIYINQTHVVATVGNNIFSEAYVLDNTIWNHLVFTYDGSYVKLYCNDELVLSESYTLGITRDLSKPIIMGRLFHGHIDNISIYANLIK